MKAAVQERVSSCTVIYAIGTTRMPNTAQSCTQGRDRRGGEEGGEGRGGEGRGGEGRGGVQLDSDDLSDT